MGKKLYVGNLPFSVIDDTLAQAFASYGHVDSARVIIDRHTGRSKGFGFVEMSSDSEADRAIQELNGKPLEGRSITVNEARPMAPRDDGRGGGGGGGGYGGGGGGGGGRGGNRGGYSGNRSRF